MPLKILLAEDDTTTRRLLTRALALQGHEVVAVEDGAQLVARFADVAPDLVLTDWHMPEMDGVEAIRRIRYGSSQGRAVFIVLTTGVHGEEATAEAIEAGADDYLLKPASPSSLRVLVTLAEHRISRRRSAEPAAADMGSPAGVWTSFPGLLLSCDLEGRVVAISDIGAMRWGLAPGESLAETVGAPLWSEITGVAARMEQGVTHSFLWSVDDEALPVQLWPIYRAGARVGYAMAGFSSGQVQTRRAVGEN